MAVGQRERRELQEALVNAIGAQPADSLIEYLPPVGWADVATKHDLDVLTARVDKLETKVDEGFKELHKDLRLQFFWTVSLILMQFGGLVAFIKLG